MEDLNHLYCREQTALLRAQQATCAESRASHEEIAEGYAKRIFAFRSQRGAL